MSNRRIQSVFTRPNTKTIVCQGDSLIDPYANMGPEWMKWTVQLQRKLVNNGVNAAVCNIAQSGARTDDYGITGGQGYGMLYRNTPFLRGTPDISIIWGGTNDVRVVTSLTLSGTTATLNIPGHGWVSGQIGLGDIYGATQSGYNLTGVVLTYVDANNISYTTASGLTTPATTSGSIYVRMQTKLNLRALIKASKFGAVGNNSVWCYRSQADLPADGQFGQRYVILNDTSTTGGVAAYTGCTATITGSATSGDPTVWEYRNGQTGESGWGRIANAATTPTHCSRIIIMSQMFYNWSSGGDTLATPITQYDNVTGIRAQQSGAATAESVVYCDTYTYLWNRVNGGTDGVAAGTYQRATGDVHSSEYGHTLIAENLYNVINSQSGWMAALQA